PDTRQFHRQERGRDRYQWFNSGAAAEMARRRHGNDIGHQSFEGADLDSLARNKVARGHGWRSRSKLSGNRRRRDVYLSNSGQAERHLLVSQPQPLPGANRTLRSTYHRPGWQGSDRIRSRVRDHALGLDG